MTIATLEQAQATLQSLQESVWIFSALTAMTETQALSVLQAGASLSELENLSHIPASILQQTLELLIAAGIVSSGHGNYQLSPGMLALVEKNGVQALTLQLSLAFGLNREFVMDARNQTLQPGWRHSDESIIQSFGTLSQFIANDYIPQDKDLQNLLQQPGALFLDIGAGCAQISIRMCELYPHVKVVALEPADKPFELAAKHIAASHYADRIELRKIFIQELSDKNKFDVIWVPQVFLNDEVMNIALPIIWQALKPGGKIFAGALPGPQNTISYKLRQLLNSLYGAVRTTTELATVFEQSTFKAVKIFPEAGGYALVTAVK